VPSVSNHDDLPTYQTKPLERLLPLAMQLFGKGTAAASGPLPPLKSDVPAPEARTAQAEPDDGANSEPLALTGELLSPETERASNAQSMFDQLFGKRDAAYERRRP
jgi:hypothetical protein